MNDIYVALIAAGLGGFGVKLVDVLFLGKKMKVEGDVTLEGKRLDDAVLIRQELRKEVGELKLEIDDLYKKLDESRDKYYKLQDEHNGLSLRHEQLQAQHNKLKQDHDKLERDCGKKVIRKKIK